MLIAEDLLLLLTDDSTGKPAVSTGTLDLALAGAVMLELALKGALDVAGPGEDVKPGRVVVRSSRPTGNRVLDEALTRTAAAGPRKAQDLLPKIGKGLREELLARLTGRGILRAEEGRILWIIPTRSWPAEDSTHEHELRADLRDVLVAGRTPGQREAALISLLSACDAVPKVVRGVPAREVKRRAKAIAEGEFAGAAVRKAIDAVNAGMIAAVTAATAAAATSAGS